MGEVNITSQGNPGDREIPDTEDGTGREFPRRAPMEGVGIVSRKNQGISTPATRAEKGAKVVGGGDPRAPIEKGVKIVNRDAK